MMINDNIYESFDLQEKPIKISPAKLKEILHNKLKEQNITDISVEDILYNLNEIYSYYYSFIYNKKYFIYCGKRRKNNIADIHFQNLDSLDNFEDTKELNFNSISLFSHIFNIVYWYLIRSGSEIIDISLKGLSYERVKLYSNIIKKVLKKYDINYDIKYEKDLIKFIKIKNNINEKCILNINPKF